ncbi:MAG: hypothetical protein ACK4FZ_12055 [Vogesella sp.]|uniref:hypothetical protein n=1 Tax=Vogesella sp. TaxID=1904252 RepID=UPI00391CD867
MDKVWQQYLDVCQRAQQRWMAAQADYLRHFYPQAINAPFCPTQLNQRLEGSLQSGAAILQVSADLQHELLVMGERWVGKQQKQWQQYLDHSPKSLAPCLLPLEAGLSGCMIASRASRQIHHFASTQLSTAPLNAVRGAQRVYRRTMK